MRRYLAAATGILLSVGTGTVLHDFQFGHGLERLSYDLLHVIRGDRPVKEGVLVYLDERSYQELKQPLNAPWDRGLHAQLIDRLTAAGARAVVFDIVFSDPNPGNPTADERLAQAIKNSGKVILAADNVSVGYKEKQIIPPFDLVRDSAAAIGSAEVLTDPDEVVRRQTPED